MPVLPAKNEKKRSKLRVFCAFLAFFLGLSLVLEGAMFFGTNLSSPSERQWMADCFQEDYQDTQAFRDYVSSQLFSLLSMGSGKKFQPMHYYGTERWWGGGSSVHEEDKNLRYTVTVDGVVKYTNDKSLTPSTTPLSLAVGHTFLLQFGGKRAQIWKNGKERNPYDDNYYSEESAWYLPGYQNFVPLANSPKIQVTLSAIQIPMPGGYNADGSQQFSALYELTRNLARTQADIRVHLARIGVGVCLLVLYVLLQRDKAQADRFLARGTGKVWFEGKALAILALLLLLLPGLTTFSAPAERVYAEGAAAAAVTEDGVVVSAPSQEMAYVSEYVDPSPAEWLAIFAQHPVQVLLLFWACYLLVNDLRYNKKPWQHGICGMLAARGLRLPIQKRMSRSAGLIALAFGAVALEAVYLFLAIVLNDSTLPLWWYLLVLAPCVAALIVLVRVLARQKVLWLDLGALVDRIARLRAGEMDVPLDLPPDHDLHQAAEDLNHVGQGFHQAVEERIRSERMKVELVTNVSHDLKTPLTSIISYTELLSQEPLEPPASEYVRILGEKSQRLKTMVQDVFEVSKAASGQLPVKLEELDLARLLRQTLADMDGAIRDSGLTLRTDLPGHPVPITADSDRMYRVFQNLIGNALKYSLPGSRVYLTLEVENGRAAACVKNTSATELKPGVDYTGRFVRGDESRSDGGSGLGLSIADSFTRACGGELTISTEADLFTARVEFPLENA